MSILRKYLRRAVFTAWLFSIILLALCWRCDDWLPKNGVHFGDDRLAFGGLLGHENLPKTREICLSWGTAERAGYILRIVGTGPSHPERNVTKLFRTTNWKRTDRSLSFDDEGAFEPDALLKFDWGWMPAGIGVISWHYFVGINEDEEDQFSAQISTSKLLLGYVIASAAYWTVRIVYRLCRSKRRGFAVVATGG